MAYVSVIETITQQFVMLIYFHVLGNIRVELKYFSIMLIVMYRALDTGGAVNYRGSWKFDKAEIIHLGQIGLIRIVTSTSIDTIVGSSWKFRSNFHIL